jgi:acyl carrier protein
MKQTQEIVKRFDVNTEAKLLKTISKVFPVATQPITEEASIKKDSGIMDSANVCMIIGKTEQAKRVLSRFFEIEEIGNRKKPELDYSPLAKTDSKCRYSIEYVTQLIAIFKVFDESIDISIKHDYPMTIENSHFIVILAPKIEND